MNLSCYVSDCIVQYNTITLYCNTHNTTLHCMYTIHSHFATLKEVWLRFGKKSRITESILSIFCKPLYYVQKSSYLFNQNWRVKEIFAIFTMAIALWGGLKRAKKGLRYLWTAHYKYIISNVFCSYSYILLYFVSMYL